MKEIKEDFFFGSGVFRGVILVYIKKAKNKIIKNKIHSSRIVVHKQFIVKQKWKKRMVNDYRVQRIIDGWYIFLYFEKLICFD